MPPNNVSGEYFNEKQQQTNVLLSTNTTLKPLGII